MNTTPSVSAAEPAESTTITERLARNFSTLTWSVVVLVGVLVLVIIFGLRLYPRLNGGQDLLDDATPAFTAERVAGDRAGITMVSSIVDLADPIVTSQGGAAAEVPKLLAFVSEKTGLSQAQVLAALQQNFPHTAALLQAIPLEDVTKELPGLVAFLSKTLKLSPAQLQAALGQSFPRLAQSIAALPTVTGGWNAVPGTESLTRFDGAPARTVPEVRDYFSKDVIPVLERQRGNFHRLDTYWPRVSVFPPLLATIGLIVVLYAALMALLTSPPTARRRARAG